MMYLQVVLAAALHASKSVAHFGAQFPFSDAKESSENNLIICRP
jgi:hypothetical protein